MAEAQHLSLLKTGVRSWNAWREAHPKINPNLDKAALSLGEKQWGPMNGGPINLSCAYLRNSQLSNATLINANLKNTELDGADLTGARLSGANMQGANLKGACLKRVNMENVKLGGANLRGADLREALNITYRQISVAMGDETTRLPPKIKTPMSWLKTDVAQNPRQDETEILPIQEPLVALNPYAVLGISEDATQDEIREAYRALVKKFHPDLQSSTDEADATIRRINAAYQIIGDPGHRAEFDKSLSRTSKGYSVSSWQYNLYMLMAFGFLVGCVTAFMFFKNSEVSKPTIAQIEADAKQHADDAAWRKAAKTNTKLALQSYLDLFPEGRHIKKAEQHLTALKEMAIKKEIEAKRRADDIAWAKADKADTKLALENYLGHYPEGRHTKKAEQRLTALKEMKIKKEIEAKRRADDIAWAKADKADTKLALENYLDHYPEGRHIKKAEQRLTALIEVEATQRADDTAWDKANKAGTKLALQSYLNRYPEGRHIKKAGQRLAALKEMEIKKKIEAKRRADNVAWAKADKANTKPALQNYLDHYPNGRHTEKARERIATLKDTGVTQRTDDATWQWAHRTGTEHAYRTYLKLLPKGRRAAQAREALQRITTSPTNQTSSPSKHEIRSTSAQREKQQPQQSNDRPLSPDEVFVGPLN